MRPRLLPPSALAWRGTSLLDHRTTIVVLLTGLGLGSANRKTGRAVQAHVLVDGMLPAEAARNGAAAAICGDCPRRRTEEHGSTCYVSLARGYPQMGEKLVAGAYRVLSGAELDLAVTGRFVRVGTYGDPAAVPIELWMRMAGLAATWTAYTHQWKRTPELRPVAMASVENEAERLEAKALGWRTYRARPAHGGPLDAHEIVCPASIEAGKRSTCIECRLCSGLASPGRDIAIIDHSVQGLWDRNLGPRKRRLTLLAPEAIT